MRVVWTVGLVVLAGCAGEAGVTPLPDADAGVDAAEVGEADAGQDAGEDAATCGPLPGQPTPSEVTDPCTTAPGPVTTLVPDLNASRLALAADGSDLGIAAVTADGLTLVTGTSAAPVVQAITATPEELFVAPLPDGGFGAVWSEAGEVRFVTPGGEPVTAVEDARVFGVASTPTGLKALVHTGETYQMVTLDPDGTEASRHFVVNHLKVARMRMLVEDTYLFLPFTGPGAEQPVSYQTGSTTAGQCSLPASLDVALGEGTEWLDAGLSYGLPVLALRTADPDCPRSTLLVRGTFEPGFVAESAVPWGDRVRIVANDAVAAAVTILPGPDGGWRVAAQMVDMKGPTLGLARLGFEATGTPPEAWDVARARGKYTMVWSGAAGLEARTFCFADDLPAR